MFENVNDLHLYLKSHSSTVFFKHFASKTQLPGLWISGILDEKGLLDMHMSQAAFLSARLSA